MNRHIFALAALLFAGGCATDPIASDYKGPTAAIADTTTPRGGSSAYFFILEKYNGERVNNAIVVTAKTNAGNGLAMSAYDYERRVPAVEATFHIKGTTYWAAPILQMVNRVYVVEGDIRFTPQPDHQYAIKGALSDAYCAVWIEDSAAGLVVDRKIEIKWVQTPRSPCMQ